MSDHEARKKVRSLIFLPGKSMNNPTISSHSHRFTPVVHLFFNEIEHRQNVFKFCETYIIAIVYGPYAQILDNMVNWPLRLRQPSHNGFKNCLK